MDNPTSTRPEVDAPPSTARAEAAAVVGSAAVAVLTWLAARAGGLDITVRSGSGTRDVGLGAVVVTAVAVAAAGTGLLRLLERHTSHALGAWTIVAATAWAVSFAGPLSATSVSAGVALATMHLLVGAVVIGGLRLSRVA